MKRTRIRALVGATIVVGLLAGSAVLMPAAFAATPTFNATFAPAATPKGGDEATYMMNVSSNNGSISTVTVTAPTGFSIVTGTTRLPSVTFTGLSISGSAVQTLSFHARAACTPGSSYQWTVNAAQKNGTQYVPVTLTSSVGVDSVCSLRFSGQPTSAVDGETITTVPYSTRQFHPDPSDPVSVEVLEGDGVRDQSFGGTINLSTAAQTAGGGTLGGAISAAANQGRAAFAPAITLNQGGAGFGFQLSAANSLVPTASSGFFSVQTEFTPCTATPCTTDTSGTELETTATANNPGNGLASSVGIADLECSGYTPVSVEQATNEFIAPQGATAVVTDLLAKGVIHNTSNNGISQVFTCFRQDAPFSTLNGGQASQDPSHPGFYVGLLATCKNKRPVAPCEISKNETNSGVGVIKYLINSGDPVGHH